MALAPLLYNITFDSQTRILYFWDKAGHEIYHCEIPSPAPALPTVRLIGDSNYNYWLYVGSTVNQSSTLANNATAPLYSVPGSSFPGWTVYPKATVGYYNKQGDYYTLVGRVGLEPEEVVHPVYGVRVFGCRNVSGSSITFVRARIAQCDSTDASVITVYDSSNNPYNAFQYTSDGTDYYYVLDGTQTDWTDDLASIGYHVPVPVQTLELVVWVSNSTQAQLFGANDYWYSRIGSEADAQALVDFGGEVITDGQYKYIKVLNTFFYDLVNMYGATGTPIPSADFNNFWLAEGWQAHSGSLYIRSINAYSTAIKTWRVRITENKDNVSWMMSDQSEVFIGYAGSHRLYDASGNTIPYDSTKTYTIVGYYTGANYVSLDRLETANNQHFSLINYNSSGYLGIKSSNSSSDYLIQRVIYKVE